MANNAKPAFDVKAYNEALALFREDLENHDWSFNADSYYELIQAQDKETELFKTAMRLGIQGVDEFNWARKAAIRVLTNNEYERGRENQKKSDEHTIEYYKKQLEETRTKYMTPLDFFKEKLDKHDWYYSFSDNRGVRERGEAAEEALLKESQELGPEFYQAFQDKLNAVAEHIRSL